MGNENSLINLGEISKPATLLIEKISEAVGGIFRPYQIVRIAKAEAEAAIIKARSDVEISELAQRALQRLAEEEAKKQSNIEAITRTALLTLKDDAKPQDISNDWIANFFDKSRLASDQEMQQVWARLLGEEANAPGSFSRKTVNLVADLEPTDARLFAALCAFMWQFGNQLVPVVFEPKDEIYQQNGITFVSLVQLENLGLIRFDNIGGFVQQSTEIKVGGSYFGKPLQFTLRDDNKTLPVGSVLFTQSGEQLARICQVEPTEGFYEYCQAHWVRRRVLEPMPHGNSATAS